MSELYLPRSGDDIDLVQLTVVRQPSYTHFFDIENNRVRGMTDTLAAMKQAIYLILMIERKEYPIYSWNYASEIRTLVGKPVDYVMSEAKRIITEALMRDDRIVGTYNWHFEKGTASLHAVFTVKTIFGDVDAETDIEI